MCFSANVSFAASAVLLPAGLYAMQVTRSELPRYFPFALFPLAFGLQQLAEGLLWSSLAKGQADYLYAYVFLFFSHSFWLWWVSISVWWLEKDRLTKQVCQVFIAAGFILALLLYLPLVLQEERLQVLMAKDSIVYDLNLFTSGLVPGEYINISYAVIILFPLFIQSDKGLRYFGLLILVSVSLTGLMFAYAFISIWCFFAAILSFYIIILLRNRVSSQRQQLELRQLNIEI